MGLDLTRTYNSQAAVAAGSPGPFGYGWTSSFSEHLVVEKTAHKATLYQATGSTVVFTESEGKFTAPNWTQDTLSGISESGYTLTMADQTKYKFNGTTGKLENVTDRNGNATTLTYNGSGRLETITDPASRKITLAYNGEGLVESAKDPMGHVVKYTYESGNLTSVTEPGEEKARWKFEYNGSHEITTMTDGRGGKTVNEYNGSNQVIAQTDPAERKLTFEYEPLYTKITNVNTGTVTEEFFTSSGEPSSITRGAGTSSETTEEFIYNEAGQETAVIDGNGHNTVYGYDSAGDRTFEINPDNDETKWTYDTKHDVETVTTPKGETTTYKRNSDGDPEAVELPAPGSKTQITKYKYGSHGEVENMTDPLEHTWKYEYDTKGDRTAETDPEGNKHTWEYNEDSRVTATVSPRGNVKGAEASKFTTKIERDTQGQSAEDHRSAGSYDEIHLRRERQRRNGHGRQQPHHHLQIQRGQPADRRQRAQRHGHGNRIRRRGAGDRPDRRQQTHHQIRAQRAGAGRGSRQPAEPHDVRGIRQSRQPGQRDRSDGAHDDQHVRCRPTGSPRSPTPKKAPTRSNTNTTKTAIA